MCLLCEIYIPVSFINFFYHQLRNVASALAHCEDRITPQSVLVGAHTLAAWMRAKW